MSLLAASSTFGGVHDFFHSGTWYAIRNIAGAFVVVFWLGVAFWVFKDARRRIRSPLLVALATLLGLFPPFLGALVYMLFRPPEYLEDRRERELEMRAMEERLSLHDSQCPVCRASREQVHHQHFGPAPQVVIAAILVLSLLLLLAIHFGR